MLWRVLKPEPVAIPPTAEVSNQEINCEEHAINAGLAQHRDSFHQNEMGFQSAEWIDRQLLPQTYNQTGEIESIGISG